MLRFSSKLLVLLGSTCALALTACGEDTKPATTATPDVQGADAGATDAATGATDATQSGTDAAAGGTDATQNGSDTAQSGTDASAGSDATVAEIPIDQIGSKFLDALCASASKCGGVTYADIKNCYAEMGKAMPTDELVSLAKSGAIQYDSKKAVDCLAALSSDCNVTQLGAIPAACEQAFAGKLKVGDPCTNSLACVTGYCNKSGVPSGCPGKCAATVDIGSDCQSSDVCNGDLICADDKCTQFKLVEVGGDCSTGLPCTAGSYCVYDEGQAKSTCVAKAAVGESCQPGQPSCANSFCKVTGTSPQGNPVGTCAAYGKKGDKCDPAAAGIGSDGGGGSQQVCEGELKCVASKFFGLGNGSGSGSDIPDVFVCDNLKKVGESCAGPFSCVGIDTWCAGASANKAGVCTIIPRKGEACTPSDPNAGLFEPCFGDYLVCNPVGKCAAAPIKGQPCYEGACGENLYCQDGFCAGPSKLGESCDDKQNPCGAGLVCTSGKCAKVACP